MTAPNKFVPGRDEHVCISLHDLPSENTVTVTFNITEPGLREAPLSSVTITLEPSSGKANCCW